MKKNGKIFDPDLNYLHYNIYRARSEPTGSKTHSPIFQGLTDFSTLAFIKITGG